MGKVYSRLAVGRVVSCTKYQLRDEKCYFGSEDMYISFKNHLKNIPKNFCRQELWVEVATAVRGTRINN